MAQIISQSRQILFRQEIENRIKFQGTAEKHQILEIIPDPLSAMELFLHDYNKFKLFPVAMKKIILIYALIVISTTLQAYAHSTILGISEEKYSDNIEINLKFDRPPPYSIKQSGRRIDLTLEETIIADAALNFSTDDKIVKFLPSVGEDQAVLSFFLRYTPKKARIVPGQDNTLSLVIDVDNFVLKTRTDIVSDLQRATKGSIAGKNISNPLVGTPYVNDWRLFFSRYEPEVAIKAPVQFTFPPFPLIAFLPPDREKNLPLIPGEVNSLAATGQWNAMEPMVSDLVKKEKDVETKKKLALTYGEVLFRAGDFSGAYKQLYLLNQTYPNEPIAFFAKFLLAGLEAKYDNPYVGDYKLHELEPLLDADSPLTPYFTLLQIETALATNQLDKMRTLLNRDNISFPDTIIRIKELRIADYWYANKDLIKSFVRYQLLNSPALLESHYYSLNGYCDTLYHQKNFPDAAQCYQKLAPHITDRSQLGLVMYRKAMAQLHFRQAIDMISDFSTIADAFPETDAGYKAGIKRADIQFISKKRSDMQSINAYGVIAERAINRETAEEAALKEALVYKIADKRAKSIDLLMTFLRNFRTGPLVETAQAALLDALPDELQHLMQQKDYMKVLVLAKQNQMFFEKKWLDYRILADVALAYQQLNLFDDSENTYRYLMEVGGAKAEENYALPYIKVLFHQGNFDEVETHALQYLQRYPAGKDKEQVVLFRLKALLAAGRGDRAIALLPTPTPDSPEFQELAAALYFQKNDFKQVTEILSPLWEKQHSLPDDARFLLAESLYRQDLFDKAEDFFVTVQDTPSFQDQSLFRLADIRLKKGQTEKAVKLLQQIVDKGKDPLWQNLARKQLDYTATISK